MNFKFPISSKKSRLISPWTPYFFMAPFLIIFSVFTLYPLAKSVILSIQQTYGPGFTIFLGSENFTNLVEDPLFWIAVRNTVIYASASLFIQLPISLALAILLNQPWMRGRLFFRLIFFSPALVGVVFVAMMFSLILQKRTGLMNLLLNFFFGFDPDFAWLEQFIMPALILCSLWMYVGFNMLYFLASLQNIDRDLMDAAKVDGAGSWHRFLHVTIPAIRPVAGFVVLISLIGSFQLPKLARDAAAAQNGDGNRVAV